MKRKLSTWCTTSGNNVKYSPIYKKVYFYTDIFNNLFKTDIELEIEKVSYQTKLILLS